MDAETERALLAEYPFHIVVLVKAVEAALEEGRATIRDGRLVFHGPVSPPTRRKRRALASPSAGEPSETLRLA